MQLRSSVFEHNSRIPTEHTCDGENINPPLTISDVPATTQSLVLIMDDPDAIKPAGKVWDHWLVFNMPATTSEIMLGKEPEGINGKGTSGNLKYHGPCPPDGQHRYFFKLYALDIKLALPEGSSKLEIEKAMSGHIMAQAELIGLYNRQ